VRRASLAQPLRRLALLAGVVATVALLAAAFAAVQGPRLKADARRGWELRLASLAADRAATIDLWLSGGLEDVRLIATYPTVRYLAEGRTTGPLPFPAEVGPVAHLAEVLGEAAMAGGYAAAALLDGSGTAAAAWTTGTPLAGTCASAALAADGVATCIDGRGEPLVLFSAPVAGTPFTAVLAAPAESWLFPFVTSGGAAGTTSETVLVNRDGTEARYLAPLRFLSAPPFSVTRPLATEGGVARAALRGAALTGRLLDYRGVTVIAAVQPLERAAWGLAVKVDEDEVLRPARHELALEAATLAAGLLALGVGGLATRRHLRARRLRERLAELEQRATLRAALRSSEERLRAFFDAGAVGMLFGDVHGNVLDANDELLRIIGRSRDEVASGAVRWVDFTPPEFLPLDEQRIAEARRRGACTPYEKQFVRKDGSRVWVLVGYHLLGEAREESVAFVVDLSKQKQAESHREALQDERDRALARLELQVRNLPIGLIIAEPDLTLVEVNPAAERIFGYARGELLGRSPFGLIIPDASRAYMEGLLARLPAGDETLQGVNENLTKDGRTIICHWFNTPLRDAHGRLVGLMAMVQDITDRRRAEEALAANEERFRQLFESMSDGVAVYRPVDGGEEFVFTEINPAGERISAVTRAEVVGRRVSEAFPGVVEMDLHDVFRAVARDGVPRRHPVTLYRDERLHMWVENLVYRLPTGEIVAVYSDATERKRAEAKLAESERALATLMSNLPGMAYRCANRPEWPMEFVSEGSTALTGYAPAELQAGGVVAYGDLLLAEDSERVWAEVQRAIAEGRPFELEYRITARDGTVRWVWERGRAVRGRDGRALALEGFIADVTERRAAEEALRRARDRAQRYLDLAGVMFVALDRDGRVALVNPKACEVLGAPPAEIVGRDWFAEFIPGRERARVKRTFKRLMAGEAAPSDHFENQVVTRAGERRLIAWHNVVLRDDSGAIQGTLSSGEDVTASRVAAAALRQLRLRLGEAEEAERRRLARELHDQVGQSLTALGINLSLVRQELPEAATGALKRLDDSRELVDEVVAQVRDVMAALRPSVLDDYGLGAALEWTAGRFQERTGIPCRVVVSEREERLPAPLETALFRIAQEALTNVARHARAGQVEVGLEVEPGLVRLLVRDDGVGFEPGAVVTGRMGLAGMRERVEGVGGRLEVQAATGRGVTVVAEVPREDT